MASSGAALAVGGKLVLAGDLGGTKTLLALASADEPRRLLFERRYESRRYPDFFPLLQTFLHEVDASEIQAAVLAAAGPVANGRCALTYLPWRLDEADLARAMGIKRLRLVNDFAAAARGVVDLPDSSRVMLQAGLVRADAPRVVLGAGTGLGVAALLPRPNGSWEVLAGEGGHVGYAPQTERELALARFLCQRGGRVSAEAVLSGSGLVSIYQFLAQERGLDGGARPAGSDPAAAIAPSGLTEPESIAAVALDLFVAAYGRFAGDLALLFMARGGIDLAGGIAPKILPRLRQGPFVESFRAKAEHAGLMPDFPVHVVLEERLALFGAAALAAQSCWD